MSILLSKKSLVHRIWDKAVLIRQMPGWGKVTTVIKWLLGLALLLISFRGVDFAYLGQQIVGIDIPWLVLAVVSIAVTLLLKALRWGYFLRNYQLSHNPLRIIQAFFMGQAANILLPVRSGEVVRLSWLLPKSPGAAAEMVATLMLEKYLDTLALTFCIFQVLLYLPAEQAARADQLVPLSIAATVGLALVVLVGPEIWRWLRRRTAQWAHGRLEKLLRQVDLLVENSRWLRKPDRLAASIGITALIWASMLSTNLLLFRALNIPQGLEAGGLVLVLLYLGLFPAIMPGYVGPYYFFAQLALRPFNVPETQGLAFAILLHLISTLSPVVLGGLLLFSTDERPDTSMKMILSHWKRT